MPKSTINFDFHYEEQDKTIILYLEGELYSPTEQNFYNKFLNLTKDKIYIIIELSGLTFIASSGLGLMIGQLRTVKQHNGKIILVNINKDVLRTFDVAGVSDLFEFFDTVDEAQKHIDDCKIQ